MFRAPLCPSPGARDYTADYHNHHLTPWLLVVGGQVQRGWVRVRAEDCCSSPQPEHLASQPAPDCRPPAAKVSDGTCGNQWYSCELLAMGIAVPETC
jgi:hypothetical protein